MQKLNQRDIVNILANIQEPSIDGIIIIDDKGLIKSFDRAAQTLFGYSLEEVLDQPLVMLMSEGQKKNHPSYIDKANKKSNKPNNEKLNSKQSIIGLHKSGDLIPIAITVSSNTYNGCIRYTGVLQDLRKHEKHLTETFQDFQANTEALKQRIEFETLLNHQSNLLLSSENQNFSSAMAEALQAVCEFLNLDHGYILKLSNDSSEAYLWAEWRRSISIMKPFEKHFFLPNKSGIFTIFQEKGCIVLDDSNKEKKADLHYLADQLSPNGFVSTRIQAIYNDNHHLAGCIGFSTLDPNHLPNDDQLSLLSLAVQLLVNAWGRHLLILQSREAEKRIKTKNNQLATRANLAKVLLESSNSLYLMDETQLQTNINETLDKASKVTKHQKTILYIDPKGFQINDFLNQFLNQKQLRNDEFPSLIEYINKQLSTHKTYQVANLNNTILPKSVIAELATFNIQSFTAVKMNRGSNNLGFICFYNDHPFEASNESALNFLQITGQHISSAIEHHSTYYNLRVSERKLLRANHLLSQQALQDALTAIPNRRAFDNSFDLEFDRAKRYKNNLTLLMCDIDFFKLYNDYYGHPQGDECLKQVAGVLQSTFNRAGELVTRFGGEEFTILLPSINRVEAEQQAQRLITRLEKQHIAHSPECASFPYVTISVGIAQYSSKNNYINNKALLEDADKALYQAKFNGRNQLAWPPEEG